MTEQKQANPFTKYQFTDEQGHALENCVEFTELAKEIDYLTTRSAQYARSKSSVNIMNQVNIIRAKWGLTKQLG